MRKVVALLLVVLFVAMTSAYAEDYSAMTTEDLQKTMDSIKEELVSRQIEESGRILVADEYGVKIYFDGFTKDVMDDEFIRFLVLNNSAETYPLVVSIKQLYVENWDVLSNGYLQTLEPGKNGVGEAWMSWEKCITANEDTASKVDVQFEFQIEKEQYNWETVHTTGLITFNISK